MKKVDRRLFLVLVALVILFLAMLILTHSPNEQFTWGGEEMSNPNQYSVLTANIGNSDLRCFKYKWKLCLKEVEERIAKNIQTLKPDIVTLQEMMPAWLCEEQNEKNPMRVCSDPQDLPQVRRLLGDNYTIVCDSNMQFECVAVHVEAGGIDGCLEGGLCNTARTTQPVEDCDPGFTISAATVKMNNGALFDVLNVHPQSFSDECRVKLLKQAFYGGGEHPSIINEQKVLVMGDFNFDPWRMEDKSTAVWNEIFERGWGGAPFVYHSAIAEHDPPNYTLVFVIKRTLDFVVSNFGQGVLKVLGESPDTSRLDGGAGCDHRAVYGTLELLP